MPLEVCTGVTSTHVLSSWNRVSEKTSSEAQTVPLKYVDSGHDVMEQKYAACQTESTEKPLVSARQLRIDNGVLDMLIAEIERCRLEQKYFEPLDRLRKDEKISLILNKTTSLALADNLPIVSLKCGVLGREAVLIGERTHDSWCSHTGRLVVHHRTRTYSIALANCPTKVEFAPQHQVIVATAAGEILVTFEEEILWSSSTMHTQPVTCLRWVAGHSLLSCGLDGRIVLSMLKVTTLEAIKSSTISVTDLPRSLKKSNVSSRKVGIASVTGNRQETYLAGETGALWTLTPDDLGVRAIAAETEGIEQAEFYENSFILSTSNGQIRRLRRSDTASTSEPLGIHSSRPFCRRGSLFLFLQDNGIVGFDATDEAIVLNESVRLSAIDVNEDGELVGIDERNNLCFYKFSDAL